MKSIIFLRLRDFIDAGVIAPKFSVCSLVVREESDAQFAIWAWHVKMSDLCTGNIAFLAPIRPFASESSEQ